MKQLIVNADDLGRSPGVNRGILDAHHQGIVTSTTVMINYPDAPAGIEAVLKDAPALGLGLHFNLTTFKPVSLPAAIPSLVNADGWFYPISQWTTQPFQADDFRREMTAQLDRFVSLAGRLPDHFDAHHHSVYLHPLALPILLDLADQHHLPMRDSGFDRSPSDMLGILPASEVETLATELRAIVAARPIAPIFPARLSMDFFGSHATLGDLLVILTTLPADSVTEIMCHPGYLDDALRTSDYSTHREEEIKHLTHQATRECVASEQINLTNFGRLMRP
ncbi:MAG TPA: ChbG/HpnK family deacetylase [Aggregatilineaceae bacterium]|nr:ChbG/HpnK family deacetylase [Aggregatilineaceae bacterium]